ncbi:hypothetical protein BCR39DRAFT_508428 [Naematelia encephala]|uniref:Uncharacterized protein n=1 Tax=Naematelia encephala TaxID=71784 RepID=A0A1Y2AGI4_9TREE|nr:hypothetical protein BCR39DRAFT_508428 [Naematelia encephala]
MAGTPDKRRWPRNRTHSLTAPPLQRPLIFPHETSGTLDFRMPQTLQHKQRDPQPPLIQPPPRKLPAGQREVSGERSGTVSTWAKNQDTVKPVALAPPLLVQAPHPGHTLQVHLQAVMSHPPIVALQQKLFPGGIPRRDPQPKGMHPPNCSQIVDARSDDRASRVDEFTKLVTLLYRSVHTTCLTFHQKNELLTHVQLLNLTWNPQDPGTSQLKEHLDRLESEITDIKGVPPDAQTVEWDKDTAVSTSAGPSSTTPLWAEPGPSAGTSR